MQYQELVRLVPKTLRGPFSENLVEMLLNGDDNVVIHPTLAKSILHYWQRDQLESVGGLTNLLKAAFEADSENTLRVIDEYGLRELRVALQPV